MSAKFATDTAARRKKTGSMANSLPSARKGSSWGSCMSQREKQHERHGIKKATHTADRRIGAEDIRKELSGEDLEVSGAPKSKGTKKPQYQFVDSDPSRTPWCPISCKHLLTISIGGITNTQWSRRRHTYKSHAVVSANHITGHYITACGKHSEMNPDRRDGYTLSHNREVTCQKCKQALAPYEQVWEDSNE